MTITNPVSGAVFTAPANVSIQADASVSSGTVTNVEFFANSVPSLIRCSSLTINGKIKFEAGVEVVGDVKFVSRSADTKSVRAGKYQNCEIEL